MSNPVKNLLVYADGHTEEYNDYLVGLYLIKTELLNGDLWERRFRISMANEGLPYEGDKRPYSMVGIECSFRLTKTRHELTVMREKLSENTMKAALWGIKNYPGEEND